MRAYLSIKGTLLEGYTGAPKEAASTVRNSKSTRITEIFVVSYRSELKLRYLLNNLEASFHSHAVHSSKSNDRTQIARPSPVIADLR